MNFDIENARRALIARRTQEGADSEVGHLCSNIIEQLENLRTYVRPEWATDERQTLPYQIEQQLKKLGIRAVK